MIEKSQIHIHRMIIHKVDHRNYDAPQLSDLESPVTEEVASFLRQHIVSNREHRYTRTALFLPPKKGGVCLADLCDRPLMTPDEFVPQSREVAWHLFRTMDKRVSPGDLVLCTFSEDTEKSPAWLALLKMDPEDGFVGREEKVNGQVRIVLQRVPNVLPRGELQKCAFLVPPSLRESRGYDLKVLDQQAVRYGGQRIVATFFVSDFLQCKIGLNRRDLTWTFASASHEWVARQDEWPAEEVDQFKKRVGETLQDKVVDATSFAAAVIPKPEDQDKYLEHLRNRGVEDLAFEPDPDERKRLTRYVYFEGDHGLRVRIEADAVGEGKALDYHKAPGSAEWTVTIRTTHWDRKPR
ncbi:MAG: nucleoid-associated protein [Anaerolineae bacterium]|nr:nucleoid-associated protein [Anaerolineae bacterium]